MIEEPQRQDQRTQKINQVVDKVLNEMLGQGATEVIYNYFENSHFIQRDDIAANLISFNRALEACLGIGAAVVVERTIWENLRLDGLHEGISTDFGPNRVLKLA